MESRNTLYSRYLCAMVEDLWKGQGAFTLAQLAKHAKLKVTPSMRRRMRQWVDSNHLGAYYRPGEYGKGSRVVYVILSDEIPF
jgi:hypothetical protein